MKALRFGSAGWLVGRLLANKIIQVVKALYSRPKFKVEIDGISSRIHNQETGIRQGCPLSPYLFIILMTVLFEDIHQEDRQGLGRHRVKGASFDEVLYADDTICISQNASAMNKLLASIEEEGDLYGMKLNKNKCELMQFGTPRNIHFKDGEAVKRKDEVKYLGCNQNDRADGGKTLNKRIADSMATL